MGRETWTAIAFLVLAVLGIGILHFRVDLERNRERGALVAELELARLEAQATRRLCGLDPMQHVPVGNVVDGVLHVTGPLGRMHLFAVMTTPEAP